MVRELIRLSKAELLFEVCNEFIQPLPHLVQALISTLFISIVPIFFIYFLNILFLSSPSLKDSVICYLISFAIGGLLGDVFFHTLPHLNSSGSSHEHSHDHSHEHTHGDDHSGHGHSHDPMQMCNNSIIIAGIITFFLIEKVVSNIVGHDHSHHDHGQSHSHDSSPAKQDAKTGSGKGKDKSTGKNNKVSKKQAEKDREEEEKLVRYKSYAVLTLFGDFLHNFTDGLSIGVAYIASKSLTLISLFNQYLYRLQDGCCDNNGYVLP